MSFRATIEQGIRGGAVVHVPGDAKALFGSARAKVNATFDGHPYRGSLAVMGGTPLIGVRSDVRAAIGKNVGDEVDVVLTLDTAPRTVELPADLRASLVSAAVLDTFEAMSFTHRREWVESVEEAKKPETRARRIERAVEAMKR